MDWFPRYLSKDFSSYESPAAYCRCSFCVIVKCEFPAKPRKNSINDDFYMSYVSGFFYYYSND